MCSMRASVTQNDGQRILSAQNFGDILQQWQVWTPRHPKPKPRSLNPQPAKLGRCWFWEKARGPIERSNKNFSRLQPFWLKVQIGPLLQSRAFVVSFAQSSNLNEIGRDVDGFASFGRSEAAVHTVCLHLSRMHSDCLVQSTPSLGYDQV